ncbi:hypothetical protein LINGRAHAP2_LOCUS23873 [Linum grandiflorum]
MPPPLSTTTLHPCRPPFILAGHPSSLPATLHPRRPWSQPLAEFSPNWKPNLPCSSSFWMQRPYDSSLFPLSPTTMLPKPPPRRPELVATITSFICPNSTLPSAVSIRPSSSGCPPSIPTATVNTSSACSPLGGGRRFGFRCSLSGLEPFSMLSCNLRNSSVMHEDNWSEEGSLGEKKKVAKDQKEMDMRAEGYGVASLSSLMGEEKTSYTEGLENRYDKMLVKIESLESI